MAFDVIIVGGSFSGLSCAYHLAKEGMKICLFEKNKIGTTAKCTGILLQSVIKDIKVPKELIENKIKCMYLFSPSMRRLKIRFKSHFYQSRTLDFLEWLKELASSYDVKFFEKKFCSNIRINKKNVCCENQKGRMIIFANGTTPLNVRGINKQKQKLYIGLEYIADGAFLFQDIRSWYLFIDAKISPGYAAWLAPIDDKKYHIGMLKKAEDKVPIKTCLQVFLKKINGKIKKIYEVRAGTVPLSGPINKTYGHRYIFVGDAAGQIGPFFSDGINYCVRVGKIVGKVLPDLIHNPTEYNLKNYEVAWKKEFGKLLEEQLFLRKLYDKLNDNIKLEKLFNLLTTLPTNDIQNFSDCWSNMKEAMVYRYLITRWPKLVKSLL